MKFALVFLFAVCAIGAQAEYQKYERIEYPSFVQELEAIQNAGFFENAREVLVSFIVRAKAIVEAIFGDFNSFIEGLRNQVKNIVENAKAKLQDKIQEWQEKLKNAAAQNAAALDCATKSIPRLQNLLDSASQELTNLVEDGTTRIQAVLLGVETEIITVQKQIQVVISIYNQCVNPNDWLGTSVCLVTKAKQLAEALDLIVKNTQVIADTAIPQIEFIVQDVSNQLTTLISAYNTELNDTIAAIRDCLAASGVTNF